MKMKKITAWLLTLILVFNVCAVSVLAGSEKTAKKFDVLIGLGFTERIEENTYLTRGKYASIMMSCYGYNDESMSKAAAMEIVGLADDGAYNENGYTSFGEAARGLVTLLGYDAEVKYSGANAQEFVRIANRLDITSGVGLKNFDSKITEEEFAIMLYNCLDIPVMMSVIKDLTMNISTYENETFLSKRHDVYYSKGIVTANEYTTLSSPDGIGSGMVNIGNETYYVGNTDACDLLGYETEFYYRNDDGEYTLLWIYADPDKNSEIYVEDEDILSFENGIFIYEKEGREKKVKMSHNVSYIYNGKAAVPEDIPALVPDNGDITFVDYNRDGSYEVVIIMSYIAALAADININDEILYTSGEGETKYILEDYDDVFFYSSKYEKLKLSDIHQNNALWIAEDIGGTMLTILVSANVIEGTVRGTGTDSNGRKTVIIGDEEYKFAFNSLGSIAIGEAGTFYIDIAGRIAGFDTMNLNYQIGWIISAFVSDDDEDTLCAKIFDGDFKVYTCSKKLAFNGERKKDIRDIINVLKDGGEKVKGQIIRFKLNIDGEVTFLQTATQSYAEKDRLFVEGVIPKQGQGVGVLFKKNYGNFFTNYFALEDEAVVFVIPNDTENYDKYIKGGPELFGNDSTIYGVTGYKLNPDDDRCIAAVYDKTVSAGGDTVTNVASVIKSINKALLPNDDIGYEVNYYSISIAPSTITEMTAYVGDDELINGLQSGDLVRIDIDDDKQITALQRIYSAEEKTFIENIGGTQWGGQFRGNGGPVTQKLKNSVKFSVSGSYASYMTTEMLLLDYCAIYVSSEGKNGKRKLRIGTKSDIEVGDNIVYTTRVGQDFRVIVYK